MTIISAICCCMLVGCTSTKTDEDGMKTLNRAIAKTDEAKHSTGESVMGLEILSDAGSGEESMSVRVLMDFTMNHIDDLEKTQAKVVMSTDNSGVKETITMYSTGGYIYSEVNGQKVKTALDKETDTVTESTKLQSFGETNIESLQLKKEGTSQIATVELKESFMKTFVADRLGESLTGLMITDDMIDVDSSTVTYRIDANGYVDKQNLSFDFYVKQNNQKLKMKIYYQNTYSSFMKKQIEFPDLDDYVEQ
ncbi:hypothetical protein A4S06_04070 [Erysipelotrichaceae bacterium MTC7]|nr:hypothetical protein A4S06_04070 [Erysipelotrichaceae bacterium MTC7]